VKITLNGAILHESHLTSPPSTTLPLKHILLFLFYKVGSVFSSIPSQLRMSKCDITQSHPYENRDDDDERGNTRGAATSAVQEITNARYPFPEWNVDTYIAQFIVSATHAHPHWNTRHEQTKYEEDLDYAVMKLPSLHIRPSMAPILYYYYICIQIFTNSDKLSLPRCSKPAMLIMVMMSTPS